MKNPFKPFTGESILLALGITLISSLVFPVIKEIVKSNKKRNNNLFKLHNKDGSRFSMNKREI